MHTTNSRAIEKLGLLKAAPGVGNIAKSQEQAKMLKGLEFTFMPEPTFSIWLSSETDPKCCR
jgi:hypothetical protein